MKLLRNLFKTIHSFLLSPSLRSARWCSPIILMIITLPAFGQFDLSYSEVLRSDTGVIEYVHIASNKKGYFLSPYNGTYYIAFYDTLTHEVWRKGINGATYPPQIAIDSEGNLINSYRANGFLILQKINSYGQTIWLDSFVVDNNFEMGMGAGLTVSALNEIFLIGKFSDSLTFGSYTIYQNTDYGNNYQTNSFFICKLNNDGQVIWLQRAGGRNANPALQSLDVSTTDHQGYIIISGYTTGHNYFGDRQLSVPDSSINVFLAKYDNAGNCLWSALYGSARSAYNPMSLAIDNNNNIILAAYEAPYSYRMTKNLYKDILAKYSPDGKKIWEKNLQATVIKVDACNDILVGGSYIGAKLAIGDCSVSNPGDTASFNPYIAKLDPAGHCLCIKNGSNSNSGIRKLLSIHIPLWQPSQLLYSTITTIKGKSIGRVYMTTNENMDCFK